MNESQSQSQSVQNLSDDELMSVFESAARELLSRDVSESEIVRLAELALGIAE